MQQSDGLVGMGLASPKGRARLNALNRIGHNKEVGRGEDVLSLMRRERDPVVKARSAWVLGRIRHQGAYPHLVAQLKHPSDEVRIWSAWALGELGLYRARQPLRNAIAHEPGDKARRAIGGALKNLDFESTRIHRSQVSRALRPPWTDDEEIMGTVEQLETLVFPQDYDKIIALRSRIQAKNSAYLAEYMNWVGRKPALLAMLDDDKRVFS